MVETMLRGLSYTSQARFANGPLSWLMTAKTLRERIDISLAAKGYSPADLVREADSTSATISNWRNDVVKTEHVKAVQLFRISDALGVNPRWLLTGEGVQYAGVGEAFGEHSAASQPVKSENLKIAIQLVDEELAKKRRVLPPDKRAEAMILAYDLLDEGMPRAKVLRFVLAAVA